MYVLIVLKNTSYERNFGPQHLFIWSQQSFFFPHLSFGNPILYVFFGCYKLCKKFIYIFSALFDFMLSLYVVSHWPLNEKPLIFALDPPCIHLYEFLAYQCSNLTHPSILFRVVHNKFPKLIKRKIYVSLHSSRFQYP
jgi:hypothetical protein